MIDRNESEEFCYFEEVKRLAKQVYGEDIKSLKVAFNSDYDDEGYNHDLMLIAVNNKGIFLDNPHWPRPDKIKYERFKSLIKEIEEFHGIEQSRWNYDWNDDDNPYNDVIDDYIIVFD